MTIDDCRKPASDVQKPGATPALEAWRAFFENSERSPSVRRAVLDVWRRSSGLDLYGEPKRRYFISSAFDRAAALAERRLIDGIRRAQQVLGKNAWTRLTAWQPLWMLIDPTGRLLAVYPRLHPLAERPYGLRAGLHLADEAYPPTALTLVLKTGREAWLVGAEHPHVLFHPLTTAALRLSGDPTGPCVDGSRALMVVCRGYPPLSPLFDALETVSRAVCAPCSPDPSEPWKSPAKADDAERIRDAERPSGRCVEGAIPDAPAPEAEWAAASALVAEVAHELRNPLTTVYGYIAHLDDALPAAWRKTLIGELEQMIGYLERLTRLYRNEAPYRASIALFPLLDAWIGAHQEAHGPLQWTAHPDSRAARIVLDARQLTFGLEALLNALRRQNHAPVRFALDLFGDELVLSIRLPESAKIRDDAALRLAVSAVRAIARLNGAVFAVECGESGQGAALRLGWRMGGDVPDRAADDPESTG
ncbi:MAG: hypothetical protein IMW86_08455 [Hydrogenibacillus sp.]|nr:hypothetical protein [Hydrogenibacillus sp.]